VVQDPRHLAVVPDHRGSKTGDAIVITPPHKMRRNQRQSATVPTLTLRVSISRRMIAVELLEAEDLVFGHPMHDIVDL
jgi:hypothetical protein